MNNKKEFMLLIKLNLFKYKLIAENEYQINKMTEIENDIVKFIEDNIK